MVHFDPNKHQIFHIFPLALDTNLSTFIMGCAKYGLLILYKDYLMCLSICGVQFPYILCMF